MSQSELIQFWFSVGSTYTYLTVSRLKDVEARTGLHFDWRPFSVRAIMREQNNVPFSTKPVKARYMWRDIERRSALYKVPANVPAPYPLKEFDLANRVAVIGKREGWCADYVRATYRRWFVEGQEAGSDPNLSESLKDIGQDAKRVIELASSPEIGWAYEAATDEARSMNIFGVPTFVARGEVFWGDDRLDDAIAWYCAGKLG